MKYFSFIVAIATAIVLTSCASSYQDSGNSLYTRPYGHYYGYKDTRATHSQMNDAMQYARENSRYLNDENRTYGQRHGMSQQKSGSLESQALDTYARKGKRRLVMEKKSIKYNENGEAETIYEIINVSNRKDERLYKDSERENRKSMTNARNSQYHSGAEYGDD